MLGIISWVIWCLILFWKKPLWLLTINNKLNSTIGKLDVHINGFNIGLLISNFISFLLLGLPYSTRVLKAYVKAHIVSAREKFGIIPICRNRNLNFGASILLDDTQMINLADLTANDLRPTFNRASGHLLIWGEAGSGKTSLACQIAKWAISDKPDEWLCDKNPMLPIFIESDDFQATSDSDYSYLIKVISNKCQDLINEDKSIPEELLRYLLSKKHILVIVDRLSEMGNEKCEKIRRDLPSFPANALIVTSRVNERWGGLAKTVIELD